MNTLKKLVPPPKLCKLIPVGEFEDCALSYLVTTNTSDEYYEIIDSRLKNEWTKEKGYECYPAPTLREIMKNTRSYKQLFCSFYDGDGDEDEQEWSIGDGEHDFFVVNGFEGKNPEELALKWWLKSRGIEYENKEMYYL